MYPIHDRPHTEEAKAKIRAARDKQVMQPQSDLDDRTRRALRRRKPPANRVYPKPTYPPNTEVHLEPLATTVVMRAWRGPALWVEDEEYEAQKIDEGTVLLTITKLGKNTERIYVRIPSSSSFTTTKAPRQ